MRTVQNKRETEQRVVAEMIALYCHHHHAPDKKAPLCPDCKALLHYAQERSEKCPFMETKTFCSNCKVHCYAPEMREKIRMVMRWSGPRMLMDHPIMALSHARSVLRERRRNHNSTYGGTP